MKDTSSAAERVGRYQLLEPIGSGPNGMVSRAKVFGVAGFERQFAVKRFLAELTVGVAAQALSQAARSYGSLEHPRIARMSEFGVAQGQTFTAVELVAGLDVFRLMQESKLAAVAIPPGGALALVSQAARAVGYAHGRGLSHLGLSPTNVIVTSDGDVKVTDFGILAATMPPKPVETPRLSQRIPYLAPEQLAGEATSAATDVFVLGVLAYELVTGQRAYRGDYPAAVAQAILAGPPAEPPLPRPIVRVLQRCLARSPFERFPDARALADALDAALRVAPVPGTRKDIGAQIKSTLDRYAQLNEGNLSGMVAMNLGGPPPEESSTLPGTGSRPEARTEPSGMPVMPQSPASSTMRDIPKPFSTMAGLAPPPIPVPPGVTPPPTTGAIVPPGTPAPPQTMLGLTPAKKPVVPLAIPPAKKGPASSPPGSMAIPSIAKPSGPPSPPPGAPNRPSPAPVSTTPAALAASAAKPQLPAKPGSLTMGWDAMPDPTEPVTTPAAPKPALPTAPVAAPKPTPPAPPKPGSLTMGWDAMPDPTAAVSDGVIEEPSGLIEVDDSGPVKVPHRPGSEDGDDDHGTVPYREPNLGDVSNMAITSPAFAVPRMPKLTPQSFDSTTGEMSKSMIESLNRKASMATSEVAPLEPAPPIGDASDPEISIREGTNPGVPPAPPPDSPYDPPGEFAADASAVANDLVPNPAQTFPGMGGSGQARLDTQAPTHPGYQSATDPTPPPPSAAPSFTPPQPAYSPIGSASAPFATPAKPAPAPVPQSVFAASASTPKPKSALPKILLGVVLLGGVAAGGYFVYTTQFAKKETEVAAGPGSTKGSAVKSGSAEIKAGSATPEVKTGSATQTGSAETGSAMVGSASQTGSATETGSAGSAAQTGSATQTGSASQTGSAAVATTTPDAAVGNTDTANTNPVKPTAASDQLQISVKPAGAHVFIDGADQGAAPVKLPGSSDKHTLAVFLPGHDLYIAEVDGHGVFDIDLKEVEKPPKGSYAGIKVLKCKKDRFYIYLDGKPTGQVCPSERINTSVGPHTVEVYDIVTEARRKFEITTKDEGASERIRLE